MKTIQKILSYGLSKKEIDFLLESEIINGCGGKGGTNFDEIVKSNIEIIPNFKKRKAKKLYVNIRYICFEHDIDFRFGIGFVKANFRFAKKIYLLLKKWAGRKKSLGIASICFVLLCKYGKEFYFMKK